MGKLIFYSLNTRGIREKRKRLELFRWLKRYYKADNAFVLLQETHSSNTDENTWMKEWGAEIVFSHGNNCSKGVAILLPYNHMQANTLEKYNDSDGRLCSIKIKFGDDIINIMNVYAPTKNKHKSQIAFLENLKALISKNEQFPTICAGDFNTYMDPTLDKDGGKLEEISQYSSQLQLMLENYDLCDIWRTNNPCVKRYTWRQSKPLIQSRLDYFLIAQSFLQYVTSCEIKPSIKTDHSLLSLVLTFNTCDKRGPGLWKFNTSLLKDEVYLDYIKEIITQLKEELKDMNNKGLKWDFIKSEIRQRTITYSKTQNRIKRDIENSLKLKYNDIANKFAENKSAENLENLEKLKDEIEKMNKEKTEGSMIRSKANELNRKLDSSFYKNQEKTNYKTCHIVQIETSNGKIIDNQNEVLIEIKNFYHTLYTEKEKEPKDADRFLNDDIPKLSDAASQECEKEISIEECSKALKKNEKQKNTLFRRL